MEYLQYIVPLLSLIGLIIGWKKWRKHSEFQQQEQQRLIDAFILSLCKTNREPGKVLLIAGRMEVKLHSFINSYSQDHKTICHIKIPQRVMTDLKPQMAGRLLGAILEAATIKFGNGNGNTEIRYNLLAAQALDSLKPEIISEAFLPGVKEIYPAGEEALATAIMKIRGQLTARLKHGLDEATEEEALKALTKIGLITD